MRFPSSLKIGAHEYKLVFADSWPNKAGDCYGEIVRESETLFVKAGMPETHTWATIIHEIFHGLNNELDHVLLDSLSEQWTQVLLENGLIDEE